MAYRERAKRNDAGGDVSVSAALATFDVSGAAGEDGADGARGFESSDGGARGGRGGDAGAASPGQDAGTIELTIEQDASAPEAVRIGGRYARADGQRKKVDRCVPIGDTGSIELLSRGGDGGDGGEGGRGGDGAEGRSGSDATRYSSGGDGGPGGDGGDGGNGSSGAIGGRGGGVSVTVPARDTHLLMLVRQTVRGGDGGAAGENGAGGDGGPGGEGGSSHSWSESESYTDSNGQRQTRTNWRSNPGGSKGRRGQSGRSGNATLEAGARGKKGSFAIRVIDGDKVEEYPSRYDLRLVGFEHRCDNQDGIYEPEEKVHVSKIAVENVGGMPTPAHRDVQLSLVDRGWVKPERAHLSVPRGLAPGKRHVFDGAELCFHIGLYQPQGPSDPLSAVETIGHRATVPDAKRDFEGYQDESTAEAATFTIRFPIEVTPLETLYSLAPDQAATVRWVVTNVSGKAFGMRSELGRAVGVRLSLHDSELGPDEILFFDDGGQRVSLADGFTRAIESIGPGEQREISGTLAIAKNATCYRAGRVRLSLELGSIQDGSRARPIQLREFTVRVGQPYRPDADAAFLLVVNNRTTETELGAWRTLASALGAELNVWDLTLQGGIDLEASETGRPSLLEQFRGRTLVVLNNAVDTPDGEKRPSSFVAKEQLCAAAAAGCRLLFVGGAPDLPSLVVPSGLDDDDAEAPSAEMVTHDAFAEALARRGSSALEAPGDRLELGVVRTYFWPWSALSAVHLERAALRLAVTLREAEPQRRHLVVHRFAPEVVGKTAWIRSVRLGTLTVLRSIDGAMPSLLAAKVDEEAMHAPEHVLGSANVMALMLSLPFEDKLRRWNDAVRSLEDDGDANPPGGSEGPTAPTRSELAELLAAALLADLAAEQLAVLHHRWGTPEAGFERCMPALRCLAAAPLDARLGDAIPRGTQAEHKGEPLVPAPAAHFARLVAMLRFFSKTQARLWERVPPLSFLRRAPRLADAATEPLDALVARIAAAGGEATATDRHKALETTIDRETARLHRRYREAKRNHDVVGDKGAFARMLVLAPFEGATVSSDVDALTEIDTRVVSHDDHQALCAADGKRGKRRRKLARAAQKARAELLAAHSCTELLSGGRATA